MANIDVNSGGNAKKGKPQRKTLRVDFTPMVDMNMLLITFFMFCTTLSIPQVMDIAMPTDDGGENVPASKSVTILLGDNDKMYFYEGEANYEDYTSLKETNGKGIRDMLLERNAFVMTKMQDLKQKLNRKEISETEFKEGAREAKRSKAGLIVLIKPTGQSNFRNLVDVLDEMQICGIDKYAIVNVEKSDEFLMENLEKKGQLTAMIDK